MSAGNVERLDASMTDALAWILNWGAGTESLLRPRGAAGREPRPPAGGSR